MPKLFILFVLLASCLPLPAADAWAAGSYREAAGELQSSDRMIELRMILAKLRESLASMKELDELERIGMPKHEVDLMRQALEKKIKEMTSEALVSIHQL